MLELRESKSHGKTKRRQHLLACKRTTRLALRTPVCLAVRNSTPTAWVRTSARQHHPSCSMKETCNRRRIPRRGLPTPESLAQPPAMRPTFPRSPKVQSTRTPPRSPTPRLRRPLCHRPRCQRPSRTRIPLRAKVNPARGTTKHLVFETFQTLRSRSRQKPSKLLRMMVPWNPPSRISNLHPNNNLVRHGPPSPTHPGVQRHRPGRIPARPWGRQ
mmetsp:Transcript_36746/g.113326  ORF Transcript_36746/g.113326 Transcript_36746/m.113326 type:complete len:215 (+) Transcript_36746:1031-1675(+)